MSELGDPRWNIITQFGMENMVWLSDDEKSWKICLLVLTQYTKVTDTRQTDRRTPHGSIGRAYAGIARQNFADPRRKFWNGEIRHIYCRLRLLDRRFKLEAVTVTAHRADVGGIIIQYNGLGHRRWSRASHRLTMLRGVYSDTTQLNSTELNWPCWTAYSQVSRVFVYDVMTYKLSQLLFTLSSWVELSCIAINTPLHAANRAETASAIMPSRIMRVGLNFTIAVILLVTLLLVRV